MMQDSILISLGKCLPKHGYQATKFERASVNLKTPNEVEAFLKGWQASKGWIARQSGVAVNDIEPGTLGHLTSCELALDGKSLHIVRLAEHWAATTITEGSGEACLMDVVKHLTVKHGIMCYHRYWSLPPQGGASIVAWRFAGFEELPK